MNFVKETYKINDLNQVRLLTDPLKLKLIQAFAENAKTTKQVANELGESVTKLYRHVDALHDAGLLVIAEEKQKRGTIERTFQTVAQRFEADPSLFSDQMSEEGSSAARDMLRGVEAEILDAMAKPHDDKDKQAIIMRMRRKATPKQIAEIRKALTEWCELAEGDSECGNEDAEEFGALIAFYPINGER